MSDTQPEDEGLEWQVDYATMARLAASPGPTVVKMSDEVRSLNDFPADDYSDLFADGPDPQDS